MRKNLSVSVVLALTVSALVAAAQLVSARTTITMYDPRPNTKVGQIVDTLLAEFSAQNPDIYVDYVHVPGSYSGVREKTSVAIAGGAAPNVVILDQTHWFAFAYSGHLLPLDEFIAQDPTVSIDDYYPGIVDFLTWKGSVWGLPYIVSTPVIYYNPALFATRGLDPVAPRVWDEYLTYGRRIAQDTDGDQVNDILMIQFYNDNWFFEAWLGQNGASVVNPEGTEYTFNSPAAVETFEFLQSLTQQARIAKVGTFNSIYADFWAGKLAITEQSTAALANNIESAANNGMELGVAPLACQKQCFAPIGGGNLHIVNTGTAAEKEAAWRLVRFLQDPVNLARMGAATGYMAARRSSIETDVLQSHFASEPRAVITYEQLAYASPRARIPNWSAISGRLNQAILGFLNGNGEISSQLDELVRVGNELVAEWYRQN